jgi:hypothetical protein
MPPDANALTFLQLQDAVLGRRFPPSTQRTNSKRWLATAYQDVWSAEDWTFTRVTRATLAIVAGDSTPTMPADFAEALSLYDSFGAILPYLSEDQFERAYADQLVLGQVGPATAYTVVDRQIQLAPVPGGNVNFALSYRRRLSCRDTALAVKAGMMSIDSDYPLWSDHHSVLIPRATAIGLTEINDPTADAAQAEYEKQLDRMKDDYPQTIPQRQWGAVCWEA